MQALDNFIEAIDVFFGNSLPPCVATLSTVNSVYNQYVYRWRTVLINPSCHSYYYEILDCQFYP